ncbi:hypothetical protein CVT25_003885 [Psilocybe cyanescens]|uniref:Uncharacterized protein n=1 Tax=Psilocybe cyanescens TaxID=93625 RepID=A0A409XPV5_PSICY|nr:hypothetical protein CVT25_003885 [Psilocybe cyanescens]
MISTFFSNDSIEKIKDDLRRLSRRLLVCEFFRSEDSQERHSSEARLQASSGFVDGEEKVRSILTRPVQGGV